MRNLNHTYFRDKRVLVWWLVTLGAVVLIGGLFMPNQTKSPEPLRSTPHETTRPESIQSGKSGKVFQTASFPQSCSGDLSVSPLTLPPKTAMRILKALYSDHKNHSNQLASKLDGVTWVLSEKERDLYGFEQEIAPLASVAFASTFEGNNAKYIAVVVAIHQLQYNQIAYFGPSRVPLDGAVLQLAGEHMKVEHHSRRLADLWAYRNTPGGFRLVQISKQPGFAIACHLQGWAMRHFYKDLYLFALHPGFEPFEKLIQIRLSESSERKPHGGYGEYWNYVSTYDFKDRGSSEYRHLEVQAFGSKYINSAIRPFRVEKTYKLIGTGYQLTESTHRYAGLGDLRMLPSDEEWIACERYTIVKPGDSWEQYAERFGVPVDKLLKVNKRFDNQLPLASRIRIPYPWE